MNKICLLGRLTKDVEVTKTNNGTEYCRFGIAVQRKFANDNGAYEADFFNCIAWQKTAEFIGKYFKKGNLIAISGRLQAKQYEAQDGTKRTAIDVVIEDVSFAGSKENGTESDSKAKPTAKKAEPVEDDDLPF